MGLPPDVQTAHVQAELALRGHTARSTWVIVAAGAAGLVAAVTGGTALVSAQMISAATGWALMAAVPAASAFGAWATRYLMGLQDKADALDGVLKRHREYDALLYQGEQERLELSRQVTDLQNRLNFSRLVFERTVSSRPTGDDN